MKIRPNSYGCHHLANASNLELSPYLALLHENYSFGKLATRHFSCHLSMIFRLTSSSHYTCSRLKLPKVAHDREGQSFYFNQNEGRCSVTYTNKYLLWNHILQAAILPKQISGTTPAWPPITLLQDDRGYAPFINQNINKIHKIPLPSGWYERIHYHSASEPVFK